MYTHWPRAAGGIAGNLPPAPPCSRNLPSPATTPSAIPIASHDPPRGPNAPYGLRRSPDATDDPTRCRPDPRATLLRGRDPPPNPRPNATPTACGLERTLSAKSVPPSPTPRPNYARSRSRGPSSRRHHGPSRAAHAPLVPQFFRFDTAEFVGLSGGTTATFPRSPSTTATAPKSRHCSALFTCMTTWERAPPT